MTTKLHTYPYSKAMVSVEGDLSSTSSESTKVKIDVKKNAQQHRKFLDANASLDTRKVEKIEKSDQGTDVEDEKSNSLITVGTEEPTETEEIVIQSKRSRKKKTTMYNCKVLNPFANLSIK